MILGKILYFLILFLSILYFFCEGIDPITSLLIIIIDVFLISKYKILFTE